MELNKENVSILNMTNGTQIDEQYVVLVCRYMEKFKYTTEYCKRKDIKYNWEEDTIELCSTKYHSNWDWLIPVVKKVIEEGWNSQVGHPDDMVFNSLRNALMTLEIEAVWKCVVNAIQVLNKIKEDKDGSN